MTDSIHTDFTCSSCNTIATSLTECDHCRKWLCQSCSKLPKSTLNKMTALKKSGFYWCCTICRTDSRTSQRKILSNSSSQTSPMSSPPIFNNHSPAPALPQPTFSTISPLTQPFIQNYIRVHTPVTPQLIHCSYHPYYPHSPIPCCH